MTHDWTSDAWHPALHGLVVRRGGEIIHERYGEGEDFHLDQALGHVTFGPETLHDIRSVTKSVVGLLYGKALGDGQVAAPEEPLMAQFPEYPELAGRTELTVEHALTMTMGLLWDESAPYTSTANSEIAMEFAPDRFRFILEQPQVEPPGRTWTYSSGASALVARLIEKGTGLRLDDYARKVLFEPLGIDRFEWSAGADGVVRAASGLRLTPRDLAKIGQYVLDQGITMEPHFKIADEFWYAHQWYLGPTPQPWMGGFGNGGQRLYVVPSLDLVVAVTAGLYNLPIEEQGAPSGKVVEAILAAMAR
ncbi:serine hydrolase domain-containing protein [Nonomuraea sp. NPDC050328]|uniref:serine hydrolase domain-containing protein n=1 Tax=Nonomuraea sp. NPDC050328 TaxID=3364361 RepID=UPI0037949A53